MRVLLQKIKPYQDVIVFMVTLVVAHYFWKYTVQWEEDGVSDVFWFGWNITAPFAYMAEHITRVVCGFVSLFRTTLHYVFPNTLIFDSGNATSVVWGCTALKQSFIWLCLMLTSIGQGKLSKRGWLSKLWFIPFGWGCIYLFNILRIVIITLVIEYHPDLFELLHAYVFKYLFYFMLFMLWVWWTKMYGAKELLRDAVVEDDPDNEENEIR